MIPFLVPPHGAVDVPTDAQIVLAHGGQDAGLQLDVQVDGAPVALDVSYKDDRAVYTPTDPFPPGAVVVVEAALAREPLGATFVVGTGPSVEGVGLPSIAPMGAELTSTRGVPTWTLTVDATHPDAAPFGLFQVAYRVIDGEVLASALVWPDDGSVVQWEDRAPDGPYCAGITYVDVAGRSEGPVEVCTELDAPDPSSACATSPGGGLAALAAWLLARRGGKRKAAGYPRPR